MTDQAPGYHALYSILVQYIVLYFLTRQIYSVTDWCILLSCMRPDVKVAEMLMLEPGNTKSPRHNVSRNRG